MALKVLGVGGSMRPGSSSTRAVCYCLDALRGHGADVRLLDLRELDLPMYRPAGGAAAEAVRAAAEAVTWADAYLLGSPDYHGSMSGAMKNFLDYHWEEFAGKLFGYVCSSHEKGLTAMDQMRTAVRQCYGWSMPYGVSLHGEQDFPDGGEPVERLAGRLQMLARDLAVYAALIRQQFLRDVGDPSAAGFAARFRQ